VFVGKTEVEHQAVFPSNKIVCTKLMATTHLRRHPRLKLYFCGSLATKLYGMLAVCTLWF